MAEGTSEARKRTKSHQEYLTRLQRPTILTMNHISAIQQHKEAIIDAKYHDDVQYQAALTIQKAYRGYRDRRQMDGMILDPSSRWTEALREIRYRNATASSPEARPDGKDRSLSNAEKAKANWIKVGQVAEHAAGDSCVPVQSNDSGSQAPPADSLFLDLRYFLEMVDVKHRYGTNLQVYHEEWQRSITKQNFFEWLDHGEKLDHERVRYLSREERKEYEVQVDNNGKLCWLKNTQPITTSSDLYKDSAHGIVTQDSPDAPYVPELEEASDDELELRDAQTDHQAAIKDESHRRHFHVLPATVLNHLLRASVRPGTWIYVADTIGRLYVGIKSSGAFQHASFLAGARISSAGLIGIENGQLTYLSPLSGHYRPTTKSFTTFVESLKQQNADLSRLRISRAYDLLLGTEYYGRTKKGVGKLLGKSHDGERAKAKPRVQSHYTATDLVQRDWEEDHDHPKRMQKLKEDLHIRRRSPG
ncbi:hypothetical protein LTR78_005290 [Recurvomyces mirabilis]|uniref:Iq calmodulin-binding motif protein n=1 Tax=Recurvomyces mirabilis TaxID=574656 RepID=A0AAE0WNG5_9PEZI|nr:hypothetical protein LTR78_005290 [Recurvomyces mirabilis]KAK5157840.1 hypothetical protein LTS14_003762 [Recurvomyces mirabilis]